MSAGLRLELRQSQQLVMTPQLQQAIKLLQMSNFELGAFVAEEIERNPLLTADDPEPRAERDAVPEAPTEAEAEAPADARVTAEGDLSLVTDAFDTGADNLYDASGPDLALLPGEAVAMRAASPGPMPDDDTGFEQRLSEAPTLRVHLAEQIGQTRAPVPVPQIALALVEEIDESGYLTTALAELAERLGVTASQAEAALALLQRCEPTGVGARGLGECLALQLAERDRLDPAMRALTDNLALLADGQLDRLRRICGVDAEDLSDMIRELRALDPRPGARFGVSQPETLIPDVFVRPTRWGGWQVELNTDALPKVLLDRRYAADLARGGAETRDYLASCRETANWLIKSLDQRARTILKVSTEIVRQQETFFLHGVSGLRPLSLRMVADAIGMHESTVSRVTTQKYLATERGIFELKYFFTNAVGGADGSSAAAVRDRVKALVDAETDGAVLSDDQIVDLLRAEGIEIARRTVAKYRTALGIPSSVARRRRLAMLSGA
ncbi:MAG: RNA polymerase factor sigma-54 [Pseudomonadota bacterium]